MNQLTFPYTRCQFGVAVRDVTPPVGIYHSSWGAALHDQSEGVHRPLTATAAVFGSLEDRVPPLALVALDFGWFQNLQDADALRAAVMAHTGLTDATLLINLSHTHASTNANSSLTDRPGGEFIKSYLARLAEQIGDAIKEARGELTPAWITYGHGRCALAVNRDYWDAAAGRYACGFNPRASADDTLLVARVTRDDGQVLATLVNYACHPTTLAWENRLLSPDWVGATRQVLEGAFGAPALFLQGAEGEVSPREQYVGDPEVADRNGRQLGYAAAAALEALPPVASSFVYTGIVRSGADLGVWRYQPARAEELAGSETLDARLLYANLPRKDRTPAQDVMELYQAATNRREREILFRRYLIQKALGSDPDHHMPLWVWRLGHAAVVAIPNEPYSLLQQTLRQRFPRTPVLVLGVTNSTLGYLPPRELYGTGLYQEQQSPYAPGGLEAAIEAATSGIAQLFADPDSRSDS